MFSKAIYDTALTSEVAGRLFSNITATNAPDKSFLATLRALLHERLPQNENVRLTCLGLHLSEYDISAATVSQRMGWFIPDIIRYPSTSGHSISIIHITSPGARGYMLETIRANTGVGKRYLSDYTRRDDLHVFFARKAKALFYTDATGENTVIFTDLLELKQFHVLQMMIPKFLPSLFGDCPLTAAEVALLKSTGNKSAVEYESLIGEFAKDLDIRAEIIRSKLAGFETVFEHIRADELRNQLKTFQDEYDYHLSQMREAANKMQERRFTLAGLEIAINNKSDDSELMEYFMCNKNLAIIKVVGTAITFLAHGYADIYDIDAFEQYVGNHNGYMYANMPSSMSKTQMERLYNAIFSEGRYKLRICAAYTADMRTGLRTIQHYAFPSESQTYLPNPHIQDYGCIGSYAGRFQEYMHNRDYVGAIDQAVVSARNLNFYDSTVMATFAKNLSNTAIKCIESPDGTLLTPYEAITEIEGGVA